MRLERPWGVVCLSLLLAACGGGGGDFVVAPPVDGGIDDTTTTPPPDAAAETSAVADANDAGAVDANDATDANDAGAFDADDDDSEAANDAAVDVGDDAANDADAANDDAANDADGASDDATSDANEGGGDASDASDAVDANEVGCDAPIVCHPDHDGDGYPSNGPTTAGCGACPTGTTKLDPAVIVDCDDANPSVHPKETAYFDVPYCVGGDCAKMSYDYDCSGTEDPSRPNAFSGCASYADGCGGEGWSVSVPSCGGPGSYVTCSKQLLSCSNSGSPAKQACR